MIPDIVKCNKCNILLPIEYCITRAILIIKPGHHKPFLGKRYECPRCNTMIVI